MVIPTLLAGSGLAGAADRNSPAAAEPPRETTAVSRAPAPTDATVLLGFVVEPKQFPVPAVSGEGRRVVFSQSEQRVWLVGASEAVLRTYQVSGSVYDNLFPGSYEVFSRSRHATAFDYSGTMEYFVRFTYGTGGSAIGFHDIPRSGRKLAQSAAELGTPQSHGCIRQQREDAIALWEIAAVGTTVVVTP